MSTPSDEQALIDFPCDFTIKVMGKAAADFENLVRTLLDEHIDDIERVNITHQLSKAENYISLSITVNVNSREQLDNIYRSFTAHDDILYVL